jgi:hypothetical protein
MLVRATAGSTLRAFKVHSLLTATLPEHFWISPPNRGVALASSAWRADKPAVR